MQEKKNRQGMQVISRAVTVLRALDTKGKSLGEISNATGLPKATVQRLVDGLAQENLIEINSRGVVLSWGIQQIAEKGCHSINEKLKPTLEKLFCLTRETVDLSTIQGNEVTFLNRIISDKELRVVPFPHKPRPAHTMANGKALLSQMTDRDIGIALSPGLNSLTPSTITDLKELMMQLDMVRQNGFSYDYEEHTIGVCAIGIPIRTRAGSLFAFSVVVPASRFDAMRPQIEQALLKCAEDVNNMNFE